MDETLKAKQRGIFPTVITFVIVVVAIVIAVHTFGAGKLLPGGGAAVVKATDVQLKFDERQWKLAHQAEDSEETRLFFQNPLQRPRS